MPLDWCPDESDSWLSTLELADSAVESDSSRLSLDRPDDEGADDDADEPSDCSWDDQSLHSLEIGAELFAPDGSDESDDPPADRSVEAAEVRPDDSSPLEFSEATDEPEAELASPDVDRASDTSDEPSEALSDRSLDDRPDESSEVSPVDVMVVVSKVKSLEADGCVVIETGPPGGGPAGSSHRSSCGGSGHRLRGSSGPSSSFHRGA